jgi:hypothetical protein
MNVAPEDGCCRECGGAIQIIGSDDCTMTVECQDCGDVYDVETDAFHDGCMRYYLPLLIQQLQEEGHGPDGHPE